MATPQTSISLVVPVFNEEDAVTTFLAKIRPILDELEDTVEIIFVNDGSSDRTVEKLLSLRESDPGISIIDLSRNFGKEAALTAGLMEIEGDCAIIIDVDLQDPPELIPEMVGKWRAGAEVVIAVRTDRSSDSLGKRLSARGFYRLFNTLSDTKIPSGSGDFRLMDRSVVAAFLQLPERNRFNKGLFAWLGFRQEFVHHVRERASRPSSRWKVLNLFRYAFDGIFSFSTMPIRMWSYFGGTIAILAIVYGLYLINRTMVLGVDIPGYASTMVAVLFIGGLNLFSLGILGEYIGRIMIETKGRPLFLVRKRYGRENPKVNSGQ